MFENIHVKSGDEAYGYEQWIQSNEDIYDKDIETSRQMLMKELVVLKEPVPEQVFGKVYSDLKEAHKHSIIAIDEEKGVLEKRPSLKTFKTIKYTANKRSTIYPIRSKYYNKNIKKIHTTRLSLPTNTKNEKNKWSKNRKTIILDFLN